MGLKNEDNIVVFKWKDKRDVIISITTHGIEVRVVELREGKKIQTL